MRERRCLAIVRDPFEQARPDEIARGPGEDHDDGLIGSVVGMPEHELVRNGADDDPGDNEHVHVGICAPPLPAWIARFADAPGRSLCARIEVDPPHQDAADHSGHQRSPGGAVPFHLRERRARHQQRFAERDDHEQRATFGEVATLDVPVGRLRAPEAGYPVVGRRRDEIDHQRAEPPAVPCIAFLQTAGDPAKAGKAEPYEDAAEGARQGSRLAAHGPEHEQRAPHVHEHEHAREQRPPLLECIRYRRRDDQPRQHQHEQGDPNGQALRIEPVGDP